MEELFDGSSCCVFGNLYVDEIWPSLGIVHKRLLVMAFVKWYLFF